MACAIMSLLMRHDASFTLAAHLAAVHICGMSRRCENSTHQKCESYAFHSGLHHPFPSAISRKIEHKTHFFSFAGRTIFYGLTIRLLPKKVIDFRHLRKRPIVAVQQSKDTFERARAGDVRVPRPSVSRA
jgi:hypothetical protein